MSLYTVKWRCEVCGKSGETEPGKLVDMMLMAFVEHRLAAEEKCTEPGAHLTPCKVVTK